MGSRAKMSSGGKFLRDEGSRRQVVLAGATSGLVSRFCIAPLDVLKIRLQLQIHSLVDPLDRQRQSLRNVAARYSPMNTFKTILKEEGVRAFWKGNVPAEMMYIAYGATQFSAYRFSAQMLDPLRMNKSVESFICGGIGGASAIAVTYPLDLLRTRFAAQGHDRVYANLRSSIRDIARQEGGRGFYQGVGAGLAQVLPHMGLFFMSYEALHHSLASLSLPFGSGDATAGVAAGVLAKTGTFPLDVIRKRLQVQGPMRERFGGGKIPAYGNCLLQVGAAIVRREGWRGLYRGLTIGLAKSAPASAITMWTYERTLKLLQEYDVD